MLMVDPEPSAEIVVAAANAEQASVCFNIARDMINGDPDLAAVCKTFRRGLVYKDAVLSVVSSRQEAIHGRNISCLLFDDVSLQPTRELHDALITSTASRLQPLTIYATTAGTGRTSLAWQLHDYATQVRDGAIDDPAWLVVTFGATAKDDWADPKVWRKAHPGIGVSIAEEFIQQEFRRAEQTPGFIASFRRLYLNVWGQERVRWLDMERWDRCGTMPIDPKALRGRECVAGLDLSTTTDLSALVLVFADEDGGYTVLPYAFCPAETIEQRHRRDRVDYPTWRAKGYLIATEGNTIDHAVIRNKILQLAKLYQIREVAYDRWNSSMLVSQLINDGITLRADCPDQRGHERAGARTGARSRRSHAAPRRQPNLALVRQQCGGTGRCVRRHPAQQEPEQRAHRRPGGLADGDFPASGGREGPATRVTARLDAALKSILAPVASSQ